MKKELKAAVQTFSWKDFSTWELPHVWCLYQHYVLACLLQLNLLFLASVLRWVAFLSDSSSKGKPVSDQPPPPSDSTSFWTSVWKQGTVCGTSHEQCCRQCCDIKGGKGRGWNKATESLRFCILRKLLHLDLMLLPSVYSAKGSQEFPDSNFLSGCTKCYLRLRISPRHFNVCTRSYLKRQ